MIHFHFHAWTNKADLHNNTPHNSYLYKAGYIHNDSFFCAAWISFCLEKSHGKTNTCIPLMFVCWKILFILSHVVCVNQHTLSGKSQVPRVKNYKILPVSGCWDFLCFTNSPYCLFLFLPMWKDWIRQVLGDHAHSLCASSIYINILLNK